MKDQPKTKESNEVAKELGIFGAIFVVLLFLLPMGLIAIPLYILARIIKKPRFHLGLAVAGVGIVILGFLSNPASYLGFYDILPLDMSWIGELAGVPMELSRGSFIIYLGGGFVLSYGLYIYTEVIRARNVSSKEDARDKFKASAKYKNVKKDRFKLTEKVQHKWRKEGKFDQVLLGLREDGKPYTLDFKEINQHHFISATTGGGKTIYLLVYVEYAMANNYPMIFIDGKGSLETIEEVKTVCDAYGKELKVFSDSSSLTYNPLRYGNATIITDKLKELIETESKYYTEISTSLVQALILFIDDYGFKRDLQTFAHYLNPEAIKKTINNDLVEVEVEVTSNEEGSSEFQSFLDEDEPIVDPLEDEEETINKEVAATTESTEDEFSSFLNDDLGEENGEKEGNDEFGSFLEEETKVEESSSIKERMEPKKSVKKTKIVKQLSERAAKHKERIFDRYVSSDVGESYLFENAASVRTQIYLLLDSELGHLFEDKEDGLDLIQMSDEKEAVFVSFDGNIYDDYIKKIARFLILDLNFLVSKRNKNKEKDKPLLAIYDEFGVYANPKIVDTVNKSRSAGFHCCIATQLIADLDEVSETLSRRVIGNTNTLAIGQTNLPEEVEQWANTLGTFKDVDMTTTTESKGSINRQERTLEAGTVRKVQKFKISPDEIKDIRAGQFLIARKAAKGESIEPEIVYVRNPLVGLERSS